MKKRKISFNIFEDIFAIREFYSNLWIIEKVLKIFLEFSQFPIHSKSQRIIDEEKEFRESCAVIGSEAAGGALRGHCYYTSN